MFSSCYVYDAYGHVTVYNPTWSVSSTMSGVGNTLFFGGMDLDPATGLYYDSARWYNPSTGDYLTRDPAQSGPNLYEYCGDDPTGAVDPTGLFLNTPAAAVAWTLMGGNPTPPATPKANHSCGPQEGSGSTGAAPNGYDTAASGSGTESEEGGSITLDIPMAPASAAGQPLAQNGEVAAAGGRWVPLQEASVQDEEGGFISLEQVWVPGSPAPQAAVTPEAALLAAIDKSLDNVNQLLADEGLTAEQARAGSNTSNSDYFLDWASGSGPMIRHYGADTRETQDMMKSPGGAALRAAFYKRGQKDFVPGDSFAYTTTTAAWDTLPCPSEWTKTEFPVGAFDALARNNGDGTVTFTIINTTSLNSFLYHLPGVSNITTDGYPARNIVQEFQWTEPINPPSGTN